MTDQIKEKVLDKALTGREKGWANLIPAVKGEIRNPKGRPKKENCPAEMARQILEAKSIELTIEFPSGKKKNYSLTADQSLLYAGLSAVMRKALTGDVAALREILDRGYGKVKEVIEMSDPGPLVVMEEEKHDTIDVEATESMDGDSGRSIQAENPV